MRICKIKGCGKKHHAKGYCRQHYMQMKVYGKLVERTIYDPNKIILKEDYAEMVLYSKKCKETGRVLIDLEDVEKIKKHKWYLGRNGYAVATRTKEDYLHRMVMNAPKNKEVDHIYHNKLDNRKSQLRICTRIQNARNQKNAGCHFHKITGKWRARIRLNGKEKHLGLFETENEAKQVRREAEIKYFGEFRYKLNNKNIMEKQEWSSLKSLKLCSPFPQSFCGKRDFIKRYANEIRIIKQGVRYHINVEDVNKLCKRLLAGK